MDGQKTVIAAALGECVHVAGVSNFLRLAEMAGWRTIFLGPAVSVAEVLEAARREKADLVGVSYRLTPENGERLLGLFAEEAAELHTAGVRFAFAGTPPVAQKAAQLGNFFERIFNGSETPEQVLAWLKGQPAHSLGEADFPQTAVERILWKRPYPILRHHFGLPTMEATLAGIEQIAEAQVLDLISLGTDQDAQENFFHPERQDPRRKGAGGVPVRSPDDFRALFAASRRGNHPLMRAYSGTDDFIRYAEVLVETIHNAWCAIPLFWFNQMDGRGPWDLEGSIREHQQVMNWYGERGIPVELNEPHHWGMRDASDVTYVAAAFLSACNAKRCGVKDYIAQFMFNSPPGASDAMDLAKMLAAQELITPLSSPHFAQPNEHPTSLSSPHFAQPNEDSPSLPSPHFAQPNEDSPPLSSPHFAQPNEDSPPLSSPHFAQPNGGTEGGSFRIWTQTRIGLLSHPLDGHAARGHLAASTYLQMALRPDIYHIVGHTEADHAASAGDIIEAVKIVRRAIQNSLGAPDMRQAPEVQARKQELVEETQVLLDAIRELAPAGAADPWADPVTLARSVTLGLMDAPQLRNNKFGRGRTRTRIVEGKSVAVDESGKPLSEKERLSALTIPSPKMR